MKYSLEPRKRKYLQDYDFFHLEDTLEINMVQN